MTEGLLKKDTDLVEYSMSIYINAVHVPWVQGTILNWNTYISLALALSISCALPIFDIV